MSFQQPTLPFETSAMKPFLSEEQLMVHYGQKHRRGSIDGCNSLPDNGFVAGQP